jgi:hypothetical protein
MRCAVGLYLVDPPVIPRADDQALRVGCTGVHVVEVLAEVYIV